MTTKIDQQCAERLLKIAVERAAADLRVSASPSDVTPFNIERFRLAISAAALFVEPRP